MKPLFLLATVLFIASSALAAETTLYDNLSTANYGNDEVNSAEWLANQFNTDGNTYALNSVVISYSQIFNPNFTISVYTDVSGAPGTLLGDLAPPVTLVDGDNTFTASALSLAANSSYWVVASTFSASNTSNWNFEQGTSGTGVGFVPAHSLISHNSGSSWIAFTGYTYKMQVNATVSGVPEPSVYALCLFGSAVLLGGYRVLRRP